MFDSRTFRINDVVLLRKTKTQKTKDSLAIRFGEFVCRFCFSSCSITCPHHFALCEAKFECLSYANRNSSLVRLRPLPVCMDIALSCCAQISESYVCSFENEQFAFASSPHKRPIELTNAAQHRTHNLIRLTLHQSAQMHKANAKSGVRVCACFFTRTERLLWFVWDHFLYVCTSRYHIAHKSGKVMFAVLRTRVLLFLFPLTSVSSSSRMYHHVEQAHAWGMIHVRALECAE